MDPLRATATLEVGHAARFLAPRLSAASAKCSKGCQSLRRATAITDQILSKIWSLGCVISLPNPEAARNNRIAQQRVFLAYEEVEFVSSVDRVLLQRTSLR